MGPEHMPSWMEKPEDLLEESIKRGYLYRYDEDKIGLGTKPPENENILFRTYYNLIMKEITSRYN